MFPWSSHGFHRQIGGLATMQVAWQASNCQCQAPWLQALQCRTQLEEQRHRESLVNQAERFKG